MRNEVTLFKGPILLCLKGRLLLELKQAGLKIFVGIRTTSQILFRQLISRKRQTVLLLPSDLGLSYLKSAGKKIFSQSNPSYKVNYMKPPKIFEQETLEKLQAIKNQNNIANQKIEFPANEINEERKCVPALYAFIKFYLFVQG